MFSAETVTAAQAYLATAQNFFNEGKPEEAIVPLKAALALMPVLPEPHFYLAAALHQTGSLEEAADQYRLAIDHAGVQGRRYIDAHMGLGLALAELGNREHAWQAYQTAAQEAGALVKETPNTPAVHLVLGIALFRLCRFEEALRSFQAAIKLDKSNIQPRTYAVQMLCHLGRYKVAEDLCDGILALDPKNPTAHAMKGISLMARGRWKDGLSQYEWRYGMKDFQSPRLYSGKPEWAGEDLTGRTILVHGEQGSGDVIQFCRFLSLLADKGAIVNVHVKPSLLRLVSGVRGVAFCTAEATVQDHDFGVPIISLARHFISDDREIPACVPYVRPAPEDVVYWQTQLASLDGLKVGIAWAGNPAYPVDFQRSMPLPALADLAHVQGVSFVSLQQGVQQDEEGLSLFRPGQLKDFAETAALIATLDVIISVDTAIAHLAGAMGKPVMLLLPYFAEWRWGATGIQTLWYPTMRLYRQSKPDEWARPVRTIVQDLQKLVEARK